jgi:hypothetical protein
MSHKNQFFIKGGGDMKMRIPKISEYRAIAFVAGFLILLILALPNLSIAQSNIEVEILPKEITSQPFNLSITVKVQPDINSLYSFTLLLNDTDLTFALMVPALKFPDLGLATFPDASTLKFVVPGITLPDGTHKVEVKVTSSAGATASDTVTYTIGVAPTPTAVSFAQDIKPIFDNKCALSGCHAGSSPAMDMNLEVPFDTTLGAVGVASQEVPSMLRINPENPDQSYLVNKIEGTQEQVGGFGSQMPLVGCCLSDAEIQNIKKWIEEGAKNN